MHFDKERVKKAIACSPLLGEQIAEEVKKLAEDWLELFEAYTRLEAEVEHLREKQCGPECAYYYVDQPISAPR